MSLKVKLKLKTRLKSKSKDQIQTNLKSTQENISEFKDVQQSWVKIFIYNPTTFKLSQETLQFYQNKAFLEQQKKPYDPLQEDQYGKANIPSIDSFYMVLVNKNLFILQSRRDSLTQTIRVLDLNQVTPTYKDEFDVLQGGVVNAGKFKEGYCEKITTVNGSQNEIWILCFNTEQIQDDWHNILVKESDTLLSKQYQPNYNQEAIIGGYSKLYENKGENEHKQLGPDGQIINTYISQDNNQLDGYWVTISDWSSCTLKCGKGTQTLQRQCQIPRKESRPCVGREIITRYCNENPCNQQDLSINRVLPMVVKTVQFSQRPWREERCIIKEGDMDILRNDLTEFKQKPRIPARIVMNNQTFSIFNSDSYQNVLFSTPLKELQIQNSIQTDCIDLIDKRTRILQTICAMQNYQGNHEEIVENWKKSIQFFQSSCHYQLPLQQGDKEIIKIKEKQLEQAQEEAKFGDNFAIPKTTDMLKDVTNLAIDAMTKEMKFESFAEKEELEREQKLQTQTRVQLEEAKDKREQLNRINRQSLQQGEIEIQKVQLDNQIDFIKQQIKNMLLKNRLKEQKKIQIMQKMADRRAKDNIGQATEIKLKLAADLVQAYFSGDKKKCDLSQTQENINQYCDKKFLTDPQQNLAYDFCFICCTKEFGSFKMTQRKECYDQCGQKTIEVGQFIPVEHPG